VRCALRINLEGQVSVALGVSPELVGVIETASHDGMVPPRPEARRPPGQ
jgi:hypothetical protein